MTDFDKLASADVSQDKAHDYTFTSTYSGPEGAVFVQDLIYLAKGFE